MELLQSQAGFFLQVFGAVKTELAVHQRTVTLDSCAGPSSPMVDGGILKMIEFRPPQEVFVESLRLFPSRGAHILFEISDRITSMVNAAGEHFKHHPGAVFSVAPSFVHPMAFLDRPFREFVVR